MNDSWGLPKNFLIQQYTMPAGRLSLTPMLFALHPIFPRNEEWDWRRCAQAMSRSGWQVSGGLANEKSQNGAKPLQ